MGAAFGVNCQCSLLRPPGKRYGARFVGAASVGQMGQNPQAPVGQQFGAMPMNASLRSAG